jgi:integrase/recombinase XerD
MESTIERFLNQHPVSAVSSVSYRRDLEGLCRHFSKEPEKANSEELFLYFSALSARISFSSLSRCISVAKAYYDFLAAEKICAQNPMKSLRASDFEKKDRTVLTREEMLSLLPSSAMGFRGMRDRVMLGLLLETGMRVSELCALNLGDFDDFGVMCGSEGRKRRLPLSAELKKWIADYKAVLNLFSDEGKKGAFFLGKNKTRLTRQGFWKILKDRALYCGIAKTISPHTLRRSLALLWMEEGLSAEEIKERLGNADTASLRGYQV